MNDGRPVLQSVSVKFEYVPADRPVLFDSLAKKLILFLNSANSNKALSVLVKCIDMRSHEVVQ